MLRLRLADCNSAFVKTHESRQARGYRVWRGRDESESKKVCSGESLRLIERKYSSWRMSKRLDIGHSGRRRSVQLECGASDLSGCISKTRVVTFDPQRPVAFRESRRSRVD
jgi:hypothetical protein